MNFFSKLTRRESTKIRLWPSNVDDVPIRFWFSIYIAVSAFIIFALPLAIWKNAFLLHGGPAYLDGRIGEGELRDRILYLPFYLIAPIAVFFANWRIPITQMPSPRNGILLFPIIVFVHLSLSAASTGFRILFWSIATAGMAAIFRRQHKGYEPGTGAALKSWRAGWLDVIATMVICVLLLPASSERLAAHIGPAVGKVSYFVGPALYSYGRGLIPGLSFFSNYGIGPGAIFSYLMSPSWESVAVTCVELIVAITVLFYCAMYFLLLFMTSSRLLAFSVAVFTAILNFSSSPFDVPSSYPVRYPLLLPFVVAFAWLCGGERRLSPVALMSIFAGLSLFWHTEIGVYLILAGCGGIFLRYGQQLGEWIWAVAFVIGSSVVFFCAARLFIGPPATTLSFAEGMIRPIREFSGGWDGISIKWNTVWSLLYNIPLQAMAVATIGGFWFLMWFRSDCLSARERQLAGVLAMLSMLGMAMLTKWVNRSLDAVWHNNAVLLIIVAAWWCNYFWTRSSARAALAKSRRATRFCATAMPILAALAVLQIVDDAGYPFPYGLRSYVAYPSLAKAIVAPAHLYDPVSYTKDSPPIDWDWPPLLADISKADIALIQKYTQPHEQALVISIVDWAYLTQAQRAPKSFFVPFFWTFDSSFVEHSFKNADIVFVDTRIFTRREHPSPIDRLVFDRIDKDYLPGEQATTLRLYRFKDAPAVASPPTVQ
ncbi:MAG: hypothetical protein KGL35_21800 [Bradyrhizobium sp.]|uniref:hypothetical protein n=1 Tax=Bradyrhizobium sp. TaxID=376 RepID=UPI001C28F547|nr:hypothetical protein [Bradyrhizobium sp.]MBU6462866.1 hypothetical protein [Pseudomonadota bacterium]MDE2066011.1 hypothetical protein [Bradyrhizobium sp.]MDE2471292.1 hypothetical protein [Bradyrhizobium sp.]